VEPLVSGTAVAAALSTPVTVAGDDASGWRLTGTPEPALFGPSADVVVVPAVEPDGLDGLFLVEQAAAARPPVEPAMDRTRELGWVHFDDTPAVRLGGEAAAARHLDRGATAYAVELLGVCGRALDMAVAYAKERVQFGRPIGSFQAVKHRCADMLVDVEGMRSTALYAAWAIGADDPDAAVAASTAKVWCSDASRRVLASTLQVHGGIGFTWESDVHLYLKRGQLDQVSFGDATFHRSRLARFLRAKVEAGESVI
jgi:alkylation response protein AidB-like acyl-CoA dehydrogenase